VSPIGKPDASLAIFGGVERLRPLRLDFFAIEFARNGLDIGMPQIGFYSLCKELKTSVTDQATVKRR
jgi:hypothetical protein